MLEISLIIFLVISICFVVGGFLGAIWVPAKNKDLSSLVRRLKLGPEDRVIEFGSGDGRFLKLVAAQGATVTGYEINPLLWLFASLRCINNRRVKNKLGSAWGKSFETADVVFAFLMPKFMGRLENKLDRELKPSTIVITYIFPLPNKDHFLFKNSCYYYKWPL